MDKWSELREYIEQRAQVAYKRALTAPDWAHYVGYLARGSGLDEILTKMDALEDTDGPDTEEGIPAPKHGHSREFSGPGIGEWDDLSTWE